MAREQNGKRLQRRAAPALMVLALALAGCAGQNAYREGQLLVDRDQIEAGLLKYREAMAADPGNAVFKNAYLQARDRNANRLLERADRALGAGQAAPAFEDYRRVLAIDPANERGSAGLRAIEADVRHTQMMAAANAAFEKGDFEPARAATAAILTERPSHEGARQLQARAADKLMPAPVESTLAAAYRQPISIEFRDAPLKQVFEVVSRRSGLNFLFDKEVRTDQRTSVFLKNSTVEAAVYFLLVTNQLAQQVMDDNTVLIYPNTLAKTREYQEMTVKTFYLANTDAKTIGNTIRTILKSRDVVVDEKLNLVIVRDTPDVIKLATRLVALQDVPEPEVMLEVEILEIKRSRVTELGVAWPAALTLAPLLAKANTPLTLDEIRGLGRNNIGIATLSAKISANSTDGDTNTLANPRIRVRNREKAKIVIGDKIPNITTTISPGAGGFASESVTYVDVGLTLNVEPTIYLNNEVAIRISLEVSNLIGSITTASGTVAYQIGSRQASTMLQLKDGENQVLAGLINNEDRSSGDKIPGLGHLPVVGRLFGSTRDDNEKTEIVLSITPRLIRNIQRPAAGAAEFNAGTDAGFRRRPDAGFRAPAVLPPPAATSQPQPQAQPQAQPAAPMVVTPVAAPEPTPPQPAQPQPAQPLPARPQPE
ncbi:MAG: secretin N-terminal domain-containing protein [Pseudomonadota bacterium]